MCWETNENEINELSSTGNTVEFEPINQDSFNDGMETIDGVDEESTEENVTETDDDSVHPDVFNEIDEEAESKDAIEETRNYENDSFDEALEQNDSMTKDESTNEEHGAYDGVESEGDRNQNVVFDEIGRESDSQEKNEEIDNYVDDSESKSLEQNEDMAKDEPINEEYDSDDVVDTNGSVAKTNEFNEIGNETDSKGGIDEIENNLGDSTNELSEQIETDGSDDQIENNYNSELKEERTVDLDKGFEKNAFLENVSYKQGQNDYGAQGTCGPTSIANSLNRLSGTAEYSENSVLNNAMEKGLCSKSENPYEMGATTTREVVSIIDNVKNLNDDIRTEVYEYDKALSVDELADCLDDPNAVAMVGVDSATLWDQRGDITNSGLFQHFDSPSDHWITVDSPVRDASGNVQGFNIVDSGGGIDYVDRDKFEAIYKGDDSHTISDPTAILISKNSNEIKAYTVTDNIQQHLDYKGSAVESDGGDSPKSSVFEHISPETIDALKTEKDTACFWSGCHEKDSDGVITKNGDVVAAEYAKSHDGVTLETTLAEKNIELPEWDFDDPNSIAAWEDASAAYAEQASGGVRAILGENLRDGNIWENKELPRLMENPNVTSITTIDPKTNTSKVIFEREK